MAILPEISGPDDVKRLDAKQLDELAAELRQTIIDTVSRQGGHLASNLGDVELTIALHRAFNSPTDKLVFDVGHQIYAHKLLTGRQEQFKTLRSYHGMSGFPCREESEHDLFDTGHSSTSISMALGLARARDLNHEDYHVVAIVGDGALTGGMCYEAMNDAGNGHTRLIVVLNDNEMSISKNVGALSEYFKHLRASASWYGSKKPIRDKLTRVPLIGKPLARAIENAKNMVKSVTTGGEMFEALGFRYLGPFDGHNIEEMTHVFEEAKQVQDMPLLIHVITKKGYGYDLAERQPEKFHGVAPFRVENGMKRSQSSKESAAQAAGKELMNMAAEDARVVAVTAAKMNGMKASPDGFTIKNGSSQFSSVGSTTIGGVKFYQSYGAGIFIGNATEDILNCKIAEYTKAVVDGRPSFHISLAMDISPNCDCHPENDTPIVNDIGMFASFDPVAIDQACADAVMASEPLPNTELTDSAAKMEHNHEHLEGEQAKDPFCITHPDTDWRVCIAHAEKIGLGTSKYELIEVK